MTNYTIDVNSVRVDFFKPSGKWYSTEAIEWQDYSGCIHTAFANSLKKHLNGRMNDMRAICLEPNHQHAHPIMFNTKDLIK